MRKEAKYTEKMKTDFFVQQRFYEHFAVNKVAWLNLVQPERPQHNTAHTLCMLNN
jgi:hypothetical protein